MCICNQDSGTFVDTALLVDAVATDEVITVVPLWQSSSAAATAAAE